MALTYGFYNSSGGDRKYNSEQISAVFNFLITEGVLSSYGDHFAVVPGQGRQVIVQSGWAWFDSTWTQNDSDLPLAIEPPDISVSRIDAVVIETNHNLDKRRNTIKIVQGTPSSNPQKPPLAETTAMNEHAIAYVTVHPSATSIALTDIEIVVGKDECPFCTSILQSTSISVLFNQWEGEFDAWFEHIQTVLSEEVVTNLYAEIDKCVKKADKATEAEAKAGTNDTHWMTPAKVKSAVESRKHGVGDIIESAVDPGSNYRSMLLPYHTSSPYKRELFEVNSLDYVRKVGFQYGALPTLKKTWETTIGTYTQEIAIGASDNEDLCVLFLSSKTNQSGSLGALMCYSGGSTDIFYGAAKIGVSSGNLMWGSLYFYNGKFYGISSYKLLETGGLQTGSELFIINPSAKTIEKKLNTTIFSSGAIKSIFSYGYENYMFLISHYEISASSTTTVSAGLYVWRINLNDYSEKTSYVYWNSSTSGYRYSYTWSVTIAGIIYFKCMAAYSSNYERSPNFKLDLLSDDLKKVEVGNLPIYSSPLLNISASSRPAIVDVQIASSDFRVITYNPESSPPFFLYAEKANRESILFSREELTFSNATFSNQNTNVIVDKESKESTRFGASIYDEAYEIWTSLKTDKFYYAGGSIRTSYNMTKRNGGNALLRNKIYFLITNNSGQYKIYRLDYGSSSLIPVRTNSDSYIKIS